MLALRSDRVCERADIFDGDADRVAAVEEELGVTGPVDAFRRDCGAIRILGGVFLAGLELSCGRKLQELPQSY